MFLAIVISTDPALREGMQRLALASRQVSIHRIIESYPEPNELHRIANTCDPDLLLIDFSQWNLAGPCVAVIRAKFPKTAIIGFGPSSLQVGETEFRATGMAALLYTPIDVPAFQDAVLRAFRAVRCCILPQLVAIIPAKAGSGASVTALNLAGALAEFEERRVLLIDGDLRSGVLAMRAGITSDLTLREILEDNTLLTHSKWLRCVSSRFGVDLVAAGNSSLRIWPSWSNYHHLLQYTAGEYSDVIVDLPESVNSATEEVILRAARVFVVCTSESPSLELAKRRCGEILAAGTHSARVRLIVNRFQQTDPSIEEISERVGVPVRHTIPNDHESVRQATDAERLVSRQSAAGAAYASLARTIAGLNERTDDPKENKSRFRLAALLGR